VRRSHEYGSLIIHSMETGIRREIHANVANRGLITNLPADFGVEVPCTVDRLGLHPQAVGALPPQCAAVNRPFASVGELTVRAALDGDPRLVRQAAMVDPNTAATLTVEQIWALCNDLTEAHGELLPEPLRARITA